MPSESLIDTGMGDHEELKRIFAVEKAKRLKDAQDVLDNFIKNDRILDQTQLDRESEKFDDWMKSDSLRKFVESAWTVFSGVGSNDSGNFVGWITNIQDAFDVADMTASVKTEAYYYEVVLHIRCSDGKLYGCTRRYDKAEFKLMETFSDKKLDFFRRFFNSEDMRHIKEWSHEIRLEHPYDYCDRYKDISKTPLSDLPEPAKMDPEKFKKICDKLDKEAEENLAFDEAARRGNRNADTFKRQTGRWLFEF